jgi:hypothetical protein
METQERTVYTADQIFALAMAAHRINEGYFKDDVWMPNAIPPYRAKQANKTLVKQWVRTNDFVEVTPEDILKGQLVRDHFKSYMFLAIAGKLNDFQAQAYKISQKDSFTERDSLELAIVSCLPMIYERDRQRKEFMEQLRDSTQLRGCEGDKVQGEFVVLSTRYNINFNKYKVSGKMADSFVDFWFGSAPAVGSTMLIRGKIKALRDDRSTQLNYVKIIG